MLKCIWQQTDTLALAISGGVDSMVLYHMLNTTYRHTYDRLILLHVNHGVRRQSDTEESHLAEMAAADGHAFVVHHLEMPQDFTQHNARDARYRFFEDVMHSYNADALLTAHHLDDHYESIIHQLLTGRYTHQIVGIEPSADRANYQLLRPLMNRTKKEILGYQRRHSVTYFEDVSNFEDDYTRNYIRHRVLPPVYESEDLHEEQLVTLAEDLAGYTELASERARDFLHESGYHLRRSRLLSESRLMQFYILKEWLNSQGYDARRRALNEVMKVMAEGKPQADITVGMCDIRVRYDEVFLSYDGAAAGQSSLDIAENGVYHFNGYVISADLPEERFPVHVRTRQEGDRIEIKKVGRKKVSRVMIDEKVPLEARDSLPVIEDKNGKIIALGTIYNIMNTCENDKGLQITKESGHDAAK